MNKKYLEEWCADICQKRSMLLPAEISVVGLRDKHCGPKWEFAKAELIIRPSEGFTVVDRSQALNREFVDALVFGVLDILLVEPSSPLRDVTVEITRLEEHPVDSTAVAFRFAGRDAARRALEKLTSALFVPPT